MARDSGRMTTEAAAFKLDPLPGVPREVQVSSSPLASSKLSSALSTRCLWAQAAAGKRMSPAWS
jgi:hypothetical protein